MGWTRNMAWHSVRFDATLPGLLLLVETCCATESVRIPRRLAMAPCSHGLSPLGPARYNFR